MDTPMHNRLALGYSCLYNVVVLQLVPQFQSLFMYGAYMVQMQPVVVCCCLF